MSTRAKPQNSTHTHTHTHTHTDSFVKSLKQIGTICFAFSFLIFPNFASAENIPTTNPGCTTTVLGADNIANGSAALEPDFSANTINTTWYSNGEQLTGNNIPGTCRYDAALTPPTPAARPGYVFGGWTLRVPAAPAPVVPIDPLAGLDADESPLNSWANPIEFSFGEFDILFSEPNYGMATCSVNGTFTPTSDPTQVVEFSVEIGSPSDLMEQEGYCQGHQYLENSYNRAEFYNAIRAQQSE